MSYTAKTLYMDTRRYQAVLYIELRLRSTGRVLNVNEAPQVVGLPAEVLPCPHPENPGKAAFSSSVLKGAMLLRAMQEAGFRYDARDALLHDEQRAEREQEAAIAEKMRRATEASLKELIESQHPGQKVISIEMRPDGSVTATLAQNEPYASAAPISDFPTLRYNAGTRRERQDSGGKSPVVRVALEGGDGSGDWEKIEPYDASGLPSFLTDDGSHMFRSSLSEQGTHQALQALGWQHEPRVFMWYDPHQLAFGITSDADSNSGPQGRDFEVFLLPIPARLDLDYEDPPYFDNLRADGLSVVPEFFEGDIMENTFAATGDLTVDEIETRMTALGFVRDTSLDETP